MDVVCAALVARLRDGALGALVSWATLRRDALGPAGDAASPPGLWTQSWALRDGPGSSSQGIALMARPTRGVGGTGLEGGFPAVSVCSATAKIPGACAEIIQRQVFLLCFFRCLFSVSTPTFPPDSLPVVSATVESAGPL